MCWAFRKVNDRDNSDNSCHQDYRAMHCSGYETTWNNLVKTLAFRVKVDLGVGPHFGSATF